MNQNETTYKIYYKDSGGLIKEKEQNIDSDPEVNSLFFKKKVSVYHDRKTIGYISLYFSDQDLKKALNAMILKTFLRLIILILTISSSIIFVLNRALIKPVNQLSDKVKEFTDTSDFSIRAEIHRGDEIGKLADSFNKMIKELEQNSIKTNDLIAEVNNKNRVLQNEIRERKNAEKSLINSEMRYTTLYETMIDAFVNLDISGNILEANPAFTNMIGLNIEELRSTHISNYTKNNFFYDDSRFRKKLLDTGKSELIQTEFRNVKIGFFPVEIRAHLSTDEHKRPKGI